jgi:hypothetical protein
LRAKRSNLGSQEINKFEIAASQKTLLAMTFLEFFNNLLMVIRVRRSRLWLIKFLVWFYQWLEFRI